MTIRQKLGMILINNVVYKLKLENHVFNEKWSPKLIFINDFFFLIPTTFDVRNPSYFVRALVTLRESIDCAARCHQRKTFTKTWLDTIILILSLPFKVFFDQILINVPFLPTNKSAANFCS